jgi:NADH-quinone oxidoreductase subunit N
MQSGMVWLVVVGLVNSVVSAYYYLRVVRTMYVGEGVVSTPVAATATMKTALVLTGGIVVLLGVWPTLLLDITDTAALTVLP